MRRSITVALLLLSLGWRSAGAAGGNLKETLDRAAPAVMRITVVRSGGGNDAAVGTGFVCRERQYVVTAYHLVAGADRVMVKPFPGLR